MFIGHNDVLYSNKYIFNGLNHSGTFGYFKVHHFFEYTDLSLHFFGKKNSFRIPGKQTVIFSIITPLDFIFYKYIFAANHCVIFGLESASRYVRGMFFLSQK